MVTQGSQREGKPSRDLLIRGLNLSEDKEGDHAHETDTAQGPEEVTRKDLDPWSHP